MITLDSKTLRQLQMIELDLLREIDRICTMHRIPYVIIAGTLLGAVRHGGFIPWDDDVDVAMLRADYERFREVCRQELDADRYVFQDHTCTPGYRWGYGKLRRRDTLFLREHQEHMPYEQGVFADVFPLDPVPDGWAGRLWTDLRCFFLRKFLWSRVGKEADPKAFRRALYRLMDRVPEKRLLGRLDAMIRRTGKIRSGWVRILMFPTPNRDRGYRRHWYRRRALYRFEGECFPGIAEADEYLRFKFGNYRQLPPESERKTHPVSAIRLTAPNK